MKKETHMKCDECQFDWLVPELDKDGQEYNGDDLYECPRCGSRSFGELQSV